ncbi:Putative thiosulfate sulfurtransferase SseB [Corynebacterium provencense]|uniref:Thiosulfate sulfurtransferase SseB n=1 Tax=Corynebacterium provencense TaxID=1737425 RepID=A0A2Z3YM78_9CORY|nr:rhodanese-like domain-containing protein [Corynebacterium provencense]AWT25016.1 Putative thiosulfate sulfurtransferase SseB [Corynebacterium provencense]
MQSSVQGTIGAAPQSPLVSVEWLARQTGDLPGSGDRAPDRPDVPVIIDASVHRDHSLKGTDRHYSSGWSDYLSEHIPGALFADLLLDFSDSGSGFLFTRPTERQFISALKRSGFPVSDTNTVRNDGQAVHPAALPPESEPESDPESDKGSASPGDVTLVIYDQLNGAWAARLWWLFRSFGVSGVKVLDGGLARWKSSGYRVRSGEEPGQRRYLPTIRLREEEPAHMFTELEQVGHLSDGLSSGVATPHRAGTTRTELVCALRHEQFVKRDGDPSTGHIPGSVNFPYADTLNPDGTVSDERTLAVARSLGLRPENSPSENLILYCGGGINAAGLALALTANGFTNLSVFDGSMTEWRADPGRPVA